MTAIDTNVLIALWDREPSLNAAARRSLDQAHQHGGLVVCAPVYAELLAGPRRTPAFINEFLVAAGIAVDFSLGSNVWTAAAAAFQAYACRRPQAAPRRILADFIIGAHAICHRHALLTFDKKHYRQAFPDLDLIVPSGSERPSR